MNKGQSSTVVGSDGSPSDLELMQYFDGELDEPRRGAVEAFLSADLGAGNKMAGLRITSAVVRNEAASLSAADDIADLVMARIAAEPRQISASMPASGGGLTPGAGKLAALAPAGNPALTPLRALRAFSRDGAASGPKPPHSAMLAPRAAPANDNSRRIFAALGTLAVAAAAALALWSRSGPSPTEPVKSAPVAAITAMSTSPGTSPAPASTEPEIDAAGLAADVDAEHGVEVAAVDFGAHMGSIFYVPSGAIEAKRVTTVVWLADDAGE